MSREGWRVPLYLEQGAWLPGAQSFVWDPCLYAKHLNCPFIIVSDFSSVLARFLPMSYPALPINPLNPLFLPHFPQMKATFLKDFFF